MVRKERQRRRNAYLAALRFNVLIPCSKRDVCFAVANWAISMRLLRNRQVRVHAGRDRLLELRLAIDCADARQHPVSELSKVVKRERANLPMQSRSQHFSPQCSLCSHRSVVQLQERFSIHSTPQRSQRSRAKSVPRASAATMGSSSIEVLSFDPLAFVLTVVSQQTLG